PRNRKWLVETRPDSADFRRHRRPFNLPLLARWRAFPFTKRSPRAPRHALVTPLLKVGQPVWPETFNHSLCPRSRFTENRFTPLTFTLGARVAGRYRVTEAANTSEADHDEPPFPPADGPLWNEPERASHAPFPVSRWRAKCLPRITIPLSFANNEFTFANNLQ